MKLVNFGRGIDEYYNVTVLVDDSMSVSIYLGITNMHVYTYFDNFGSYYRWESQTKKWLYKSGNQLFTPEIQQDPPFWKDEHWLVVDKCIKFTDKLRNMEIT